MTSWESWKITKVQRPQEDMIYPEGNKELKIRIRHAQRIHLAAEKHS